MCVIMYLDYYYINDCTPLHVLVINEWAPLHILKVLFRLFSINNNELWTSQVDYNHLNSTSHCSITWLPVGKFVRKEVGQRAELGALCCPRHCRMGWTAVGMLMPAHRAIHHFVTAISASLLIVSTMSSVICHIMYCWLIAASPVMAKQKQPTSINQRRME